MKVVATDDERFADLVDYPFAPNRYTWDGLNLHYLDEGSGPPVVLFHGEPTWSFLYRRVIPVLTAAGYRAIAPDYPGFGKSDKPTDPEFYTYDMLVGAMGALVQHLDLRNATAVVQDWGGPIGLRVATENPDRFQRLSLLNTGLFTGGGGSPAFSAWRDFVEGNPDLPIAMIMANAAASPGHQRCSPDTRRHSPPGSTRWGRGACRSSCRGRQTIAVRPRWPGSARRSPPGTDPPRCCSPREIPSSRCAPGSASST